MKTILLITCLYFGWVFLCFCGWRHEHALLLKDEAELAAIKAAEAHKP